MHARVMSESPRASFIKRPARRGGTAGGKVLVEVAWPRAVGAAGTHCRMLWGCVGQTNRERCALKCALQRRSQHTVPTSQAGERVGKAQPFSKEWKMMYLVLVLSLRDSAWSPGALPPPCPLQSLSPLATQGQHSPPCPDGAPRDRQVPWPQEYPGKGFTCSYTKTLHHALGCPWLPSCWAWFTTKVLAWRLT